MCLLCSVPENNATEYAIPFRAVPWNNGNPFYYKSTVVRISTVFQNSVTYIGVIFR